MIAGYPIMLVLLAVSVMPLSVLKASIPDIIAVEPSLKSTNLEPIDNVGLGEQVVISVSLKNKNQTDVSILTLVEVRASSGITESISYQTSEMAAGEQTEIGVSWLPVYSDTYTLRAFSITGFENPNILSALREKEVTVGEN